MRARRSGWSTSAASAPAHLGRPTGGRAPPMPVTPSTHRLVRAAAGPGHLRHPGRGRLEEDDAEALLLEPEPAVAAQHGEDVGQRRTARGQVVVGDPAEEAHRGAAASGQALEAGAVAAGAGDDHHQVGPGRRPAGPRRAMSTSKPLRGTSRLRPSTTVASVGQAEAAPGLRPGPQASSGTNRSTSTPGGTTTVGSACAGRPLAPRRPGSGRPRPPARRRAARGPAAGAGPGSRPGIVDLGAVEHDAVGPRQARADARPGAAPGRAARAGRRPRSASAVDLADQPGVGSSTRRRRPLDAERLLGVPGRGARVGRGQHGRRRRAAAGATAPTGRTGCRRSWAGSRW